jgi:PAS domain S-box-containing protein
MKVHWPIRIPSLAHPSQAPLRLALLYLLIAGAWIAFSDQLLALFAPDESALIRWGTFKGWGFVVVTAALLYFTLRREFTKFHLATAALRESEERFRRAIHEAPNPILLHAEDGEVLTINKAWVDLTGYSHAEVPTIAAWVEKAYGERAGMVRAEINRLYGSTSRVDEGEDTIRTADGKTRTWEFSSAPLGKLPDGRRLVVSMAMDITARKRAESERERLLNILEASLNEIYIFAPDTFKFQYVNLGAVRNLGYSLEHLKTLTPLELKPEFTEETFREMIGPLLRREKEVHVFETVHRRADASLYPVEVHLQLVESAGERVMLAVILDIAKRKQAEDKLRESEERYRLFVETSPYGIGVHQDGMLVFANPAAARLFRAERVDNLIGRPIMELIHPENRELARERIERMLKGEQGLYPTEDRYVRVDGSIMPVEVVAAPFMHQDRPAVQVIVQDITERKRAEEALRRRADELAALYQASQSLIKLHTPKTLAAEIIHVLEATLGYDYGALLLIDQPSGQLVPFALTAQGRGPEFTEADRVDLQSHGLRVGRGLTGWVAQTGQSARVGDVRTDPRYLAVRDDVRSELCVPLRAGDQIIGVVNVESALPGAYTESDQRVLETIAAQIAIALQNARLFQSVTEQGEQLRGLSTRLTEVEENERRTLARELHDRVGQALTALGLNLNIVRNQLSPESPEAVQKRLDDSLRLVEETVALVRNVMTELRPPMLDDYGLFASLRWLGEQFAERNDIAVSIGGTDLNPRPSIAVETALFRIAQEALNNVSKYAQASRVAITLEHSAGGFCLTIADNGIGFDPALARAPRGPHGWGLIHIRERAEAVGGHWRIDSRPGEGTKVIVEV